MILDKNFGMKCIGCTYNFRLDGGKLYFKEKNQKNPQ